MRKLLLLAIGLTVISCGPPHSDLYLEAQLNQIEKGTPVYVTEVVAKGEQLIDSVSSKKGKVYVDLPQSEQPTLNVLHIGRKNSTDRLYFVNENTPVKVVFYPDSINSSSLEGGEANAKLKTYMEEVNKHERELRALEAEYTQEELKEPRIKNQVRIKQKELNNRLTNYRRKIIKENPDQLYSLVVYNDLIHGHTVPVSSVRRVYNGFSKEVKATEAGKFMSKEYVKADPLAIGNVAPGFSANTPKGEELALKEALGEQYTLIDFWAAWCMPCRRENPNLVKIYDEYKDRGFTILGVSLDRNKRSWTNAIAKDGLEWAQISNLQFWQDPIAQKYRVRSIPTNFLLDKDGVIIAKNLRGARLKAKIEELLGE